MVVSPLEPLFNSIETDSPRRLDESGTRVIVFEIVLSRLVIVM